MDLDPQVVALGVRLAEIGARNTATSVSTRLRTARAAKRDAELLAELEEIIAELTQDRSELLQIAQAYKEQLAGQTITTTEVEYITSQLVPKLQELLAATSTNESAEELLDAVHSIISVETLTILQLLGFNFKKAVGEPLTLLVAALISARMPSPSTANTDLQRLTIEREIAVIEIAKDEAACRRLRALSSGEEL